MDIIWNNIPKWMIDIIWNNIPVQGKIKNPTRCRVFLNTGNSHHAESPLSPKLKSLKNSL